MSWQQAVPLYTHVPPTRHLATDALPSLLSTLFSPVLLKSQTWALQRELQPMMGLLIHRLPTGILVGVLSSRQEWRILDFRIGCSLHNTFYLNSVPEMDIQYLPGRKMLCNSAGPKLLDTGWNLGMKGVWLRNNVRLIRIHWSLFSATDVAF